MSRRQTSFRIPEDLQSLIIASADLRGRSLTREIEHRLRMSFAEESKVHRAPSQPETPEEFSKRIVGDYLAFLPPEAVGPIIEEIQRCASAFADLAAGVASESEGHGR